MYIGLRNNLLDQQSIKNKQIDSRILLDKNFAKSSSCPRPNNKRTDKNKKIVKLPTDKK